MNTEEYTIKYQLARQIAVDIETMPDDSVLDLLPEPSIDSRLKDPEKIEKALSAAKAKQIDGMALTPLTGKVASIGYVSHVADEGFCDIGRSEKDMLDSFFKTIQGKQIITYNGKGFDLPFVFKRGIILGCEWATVKGMKEYTDRFKSERKHIDLMTEFCDFGKFEKMSNLARFILKDVNKIDFDITKIKELVQTEEGREQVAKYNIQDCVVTWRLAERMGFINV